MLQATVRWGKEPGVVLKPHRFRMANSRPANFKAAEVSGRPPRKI